MRRPVQTAREQNPVSRSIVRERNDNVRVKAPGFSCEKVLVNICLSIASSPPPILTRTAEPSFLCAKKPDDDQCFSSSRLNLGARSDTRARLGEVRTTR